MNTKHCYDIHHTLAIDYINGALKIGTCCQSGRIAAGTTKIQDLWNSEKLIEIRSLNLKNQLPGEFCKACVNSEKNGNISRRIDTQEFYQGWNTSKKLRSLDIKLGNLCNLKCTICGPESSTAWLPDAKKLGFNIDTNLFYDKHYNNTLQLDIDDAEVIKDLEMIKFWGGEPLINENHAKILELLDQHQILKNCRVVYNTNATHTVSDKVLELWSRAKLVELYFSIDDIGDRFNYQRYGANWNQVLKNLNWFYYQLPSNHLMYIMTTISYLNLWYLPELVEWKNKNFLVSRETDPIKLLLQPALGLTSCQHVDSTIYSRLKQKFQNYNELDYAMNMITPVDHYRPSNFLAYIHKLDNIRNTNWSLTFSEFSNLLLSK